VYVTFRRRFLFIYLFIIIITYYRSGDGIMQCAGDGGVDIDKPEQTAQTEKREDNRLLEVDRVHVTTAVNDDCPRYALRQRTAETIQQERVVITATYQTAYFKKCFSVVSTETQTIWEFLK